VDDPRFTLDPRRLERILAPLRSDPSRLTVRFEDLHGGGRPSTPPGSAGEADSTPGPGDAIREVRVDGRLAGRLIAAGLDVELPSVTAALDAIALGFGELIAESRARVAIERTLETTLQRPSSEHLEAIEAELELGRQQQRRIVEVATPDIPGYELASHYEPAREIGGDFYELFRLRGHGRSLGVVIADVTGKGVAAGLLMAFSRPVIHGALDQAAGPADALERTNRILVEERRSSLFITVLAATLELRTGEFLLANAGHECPILVPADGSPIRLLGAAGVLLGAFRTLDLEDTAGRLQPGDVLLLYTDGVTDAVGPGGDRFGDDRLARTIEQARGGTAHELVAAIRDAVDDFGATVEPADDVTIVAVRRLPLA
jgi:sigma-B regulation protein RsbU (phosphoserine phosphatase)